MLRRCDGYFLTQKYSNRLCHYSVWMDAVLGLEPSNVVFYDDVKCASSGKPE